MNLWIRSQDKQLLIPINDILKVSEGSLIQTSTRPYMVEKHYNIMYRNIPLGEYKSDKRALEVLDEIEERIMIINTISLVKDSVSLIAYKNALSKEKIKGIGYPYQMPKE